MFAIINSAVVITIIIWPSCWPNLRHEVFHATEFELDLNFELKAQCAHDKLTLISCCENTLS